MIKKLKFKEIDELGERLGKYVKSGEVIALIGDLGTGKTTFTKSFARGLNIDENIKSPTFTYVLEYLEGRLPLYHFDVYRITDESEIYEIGYEEYIYGDGVSIIEWANIIESELPSKYLKIELRYTGEDEEREIELNYIGDVEREEEILRYVNFSD